MEMKRYLKFIKVGDIVIVFFLVISVVVSSGWFWFGGGSQDDKIVVVEVKGEVKKEIEFPDDSATKTVDIDIPRGEATLELKNAQVRVKPMPAEVCPKGICYSTGWIRYQNETIVCLPNELAISIEGEKEEDREFDSITW